MPLYSPDMYGTGKDGLRVEDYCRYCYRNGEFSEDVTMEEMIRLCANYVDSNSRDFRIANMRLQYPYLKRWARKEETQHEHYKSINKVLEYIHTHLHETANLKTLAEVACISPYHFHRIFKTIIGESLAEYTQRRRMEYVAEQLKKSPLSLGELAERTGYSSEQALSRAFKRYFNLPPRVFKISFFQETFSNELQPRICKVAAKNLIVLQEDEPNKQNWQKLYVYAMMNRLLSDSTESIEIVREGAYLPALTTERLIQSNVHIDSMVLPEGIYAIFTHKGDVGGIPELCGAIFNYWLPKSKYQYSAHVSYVVYLNNPAMVHPKDLLTEIYVPIMVDETEKGADPKFP